MINLTKDQINLILNCISVADMESQVSTKAASELIRYLESVYPAAFAGRYRYWDEWTETISDSDE